MSIIYKNREMEEVAEEWKEHLLNDPELRARQFQRALPYSGRDTERLVLKARELLVEDIEGELGEKLAKKVANTLVAKQAVEFFVVRTRRRGRA